MEHNTRRDSTPDLLVPDPDPEFTSALLAAGPAPEFASWLTWTDTTPEGQAELSRLKAIAVADWAAGRVPEPSAPEPEAGL